jgi:hypothetical protein
MVSICSALPMENTEELFFDCRMAGLRRSVKSSLS